MDDYCTYTCRFPSVAASKMLVSFRELQGKAELEMVATYCTYIHWSFSQHFMEYGQPNSIV